MIAKFLFGIAVAFAALGLLTVFRIPDWIDWKLTVVACSFGYALAAVPLAAALLAWCLPASRGGMAVATGIAGLLGFGLLAQPCVQALSLIHI